MTNFTKTAIIAATCISSISLMLSVSALCMCESQPPKTFVMQHGKATLLASNDAPLSLYFNDEGDATVFCNQASLKIGHVADVVSDGPYRVTAISPTYQYGDVFADMCELDKNP